MHRRKPPYSARWDQIRAGLGSLDRTTAWLAAGRDAWDQAQCWADTRRLFLVVPPYEDPAEFDWRQLRAVPPPALLLGRDLTIAQLDRIAAAVLRDGCERIFWPYMRPDGVFGFRYVPDRRRAA